MCGSWCAPVLDVKWCYSDGAGSYRLSRYQQFKDFQRRILVATNLFGRGMDIERVNIAFNYDMPEDSDTYLHRVSVASQRAGSKIPGVLGLSGQVEMARREGG